MTELLDFIQVFADAASHVPRHRRNHLFVRFIEVLGPKDFLAPVCSLLVDKVAVKFVKSHDTSLIALPTAVMHAFPVEIQISVSQIVDTDWGCPAYPV